MTRRASSAVEAARSVDAERYAPYEWHSAVTYLHKAREMAGVADFEASIEFGRRAEKFAIEARELAARRIEQPEAMNAWDAPEKENANTGEQDEADAQP